MVAYGRFTHTVADRLREIVGQEYYSDSIEDLTVYSKDSTILTGVPEAVVATTELQTGLSRFFNLPTTHDYSHPTGEWNQWPQGPLWPSLVAWFSTCLQ